MKRIIISMFAIVAISIVFACVYVASGSAATPTPAATVPSALLTWSATTANTDGSPALNITYNVYQGLSGKLSKSVSGVNALTATITTGLTRGVTECFAVTAVEAGVESAQSAQACAAIGIATPLTPTSVTVTVKQ
jgi:hypothetical protein